jgi:uncharacterized protein YxjI
MAVRVECACGATYDLKDEYAGRKVACARCGAAIQVPLPAAPQDAIFDRDKFLLRQKFMSLTGEKYHVWDDQGHELLYVERPYHTGRGLLALFAALGTAIVSVIIVVSVAGAVHGSALQAVIGCVGAAAAIAATVAVAVLCLAKRHVTFYRDDARTQRLLDIIQLAKFHALTATYTVKDAVGNDLAVLRKHYVYDLFRKRWYCYKPSGEAWCVIKEDSFILSLLRRFLGSFFGVLRTNFIFTEPATGNVLGEFNRKFTILDRYVLDMTADPARKIDRRVALAVGVMLDTGERR